MSSPSEKLDLLSSRSDRCRVHCSEPWLHVVLPGDYQCLSFAPHRGGLVGASQVSWLAVTSEDLKPPLDPLEVYRAKGRSADVPLAMTVGLMTSADITNYQHVMKEERGLKVEAIVTVGLGNALRVGDPVGVVGRIRKAPSYGTINIALVAHVGLSVNAMLELSTIAAEARTVAMLDAGVLSRMSGEPASGTGTDCIAVLGSNLQGCDYAGKHTALGALAGEAALEATSQGINLWLEKWGEP